MKKLIPPFVIIAFFAIIFISCNKENTTSSSGGSSGGTQTFTSTPSTPIPIAPHNWTNDSLNATISVADIQNVSDIKLNLSSLENIVAQDLKFVLVHKGIEVLVIDTLTALGTGNMTNTILSDSSMNLISMGTYPYSGTYRPSNPLSNFINSDASGYWTLRIYNNGTLRTGVIKSWGITVNFRPTLQIPSLNKAYLPILGNTHKFYLCDTNIQPGAGGSNITWDFSNLVYNTFEYTDEYVEPILSPQFWHFPQSNLGKRNFQLNGNFMTFIKTDLNIGLLQGFGEADSSSGGLKMMKFDPPMTNLNGTITYNTINIDSGYLYTVNLGINHNGLYVDTIKGDGWGIIKLPNNVVYNNVLRTRNVIAMYDTLSGSNLKFMNSQIYSWYAIGYKFPVFRITIYMEQSMGGPTIWEKKVYYTTQNVQIN
jgi:hypothetical protein